MRLTCVFIVAVVVLLAIDSSSKLFTWIRIQVYNHWIILSKIIFAWQIDAATKRKHYLNDKLSGKNKIDFKKRFVNV